MKPQHCFSENFYGASTVGERGQIVIPAEARTELDIHPGDKVLIIRHPVHKGLMIFKIDHIREFLDDMDQTLKMAAAHEEQESEK